MIRSLLSKLFKKKKMMNEVDHHKALELRRANAILAKEKADEIRRNEADAGLISIIKEHSDEIVEKYANGSRYVSFYVESKKIMSECLHHIIYKYGDKREKRIINTINKDLGVEIICIEIYPSWHSKLEKNIIMDFKYIKSKT